MDRRKDPFLEILPQLNVHGEYADTVMTVVNDFIKENIALKNYKICVIHGHSSDILKRKIHESLKHNRLVKNYYLYNYNIGCTIIELKEGE